MSLTLGLEHARVDGSREPLRFARFAPSMVGVFTRATRAHRSQLPEMGVNAEDRDARIFGGVSTMAWNEFKFHSRRKCLPVSRGAGIRHTDKQQQDRKRQQTTGLRYSGACFLHLRAF